jgi:hypothetical protein
MRYDQHVWEQEQEEGGAERRNRRRTAFAPGIRMRASYERYMAATGICK